MTAQDMAASGGGFALSGRAVFVGLVVAAVLDLGFGISLSR